VLLLSCSHLRPVVLVVDVPCSFEVLPEGVAAQGHEQHRHGEALELPGGHGEVRVYRAWLGGAGSQQGLGGIEDAGLDGLLLVAWPACVRTLAAAMVAWRHGTVGAGKLHHLARYLLRKGKSCKMMKLLVACSVGAHRVLGFYRLPMQGVREAGEQPGSFAGAVPRLCRVRPTTR
jgi:hypothetical protein